MKSIYSYYKQRLIEISGKNRSLFSKHITNKYSYDIGKVIEGDYDEIETFVNFLWKGKMLEWSVIGKESKDRVYKNFNVDQKAVKRYKDTEELSIEEVRNENLRRERIKKDELKKVSQSQVRYLKNMMREIEEFYAETGRYELYVGFPYVEGSIGNDLVVKAPLILFPVVIDTPDENNATIRLKQDESIKLNKVLLLAYANAKKININDLEMDYDNLYSQGYKNIDDILEYLKTFGIRFSYSERKGIFNYERAREPKIGDPLQVKHYAVIGRFPLTNEVYNDYTYLEKKHLTTEAIDELLLAKNVKPIKKPDTRLFSVNDLDYAQEDAINQLNKNGNIVVYGPPGTGKSQTIVNIISDAIAKNKKVLVVSQKKAALDVVYNRLANLNSKAMFITDPNSRKAEFYTKVNATHLSVITENIKNYANEYEEVTNKLEHEIEELNTISNILFTKTKFGLTLQQMYANSHVIGKKTNEYIIYQNMLKNDEIMNMNYRILSDSIRVIKEKKKDKLYYKFIEYKKSNPLIDYIKSDLDVHTLNQAINLINKVVNSRFIPFDIAKHANARELLSYYIEHGENGRVKYKPLTKFIATTKNPKLYSNLKLSCLAFPIYPFVKNKANNYEKEIEQGFEKTLQALKEYTEDYEILKDVLDEKGYFLVLDNLISGNTLFLRLLNNALNDYVEIRDINISLQDLSPEQKVILKFSYKNSKNLKNFEEIIDNLLNIRIYHETVEKENENGKGLAKLLDFENIKNRIISLKKEQREISKKIAVQNSNETYINYFNAQKNNKDYLYQISKQQNLWPIRRTLEIYQDYLFKLFPCWLLSPENVSQIIPLKKELFDLILFDEASQVFIENTLPTIFRGKNIVVAGDSKQLKPTAIFAKRYMGNDNIDEMDYSVQAALEVESLLDLATSRYHSTNLTYHYRSKNEELINFSNHAFYDTRLQISPNTTKNINKKPIERIKVNGKWIDRCNLVEANAVVELLKRFSRTPNFKSSIGIITFNVEQESVIEDSIDKLREKDQSFANFILKQENRIENGENISLFIKNLENVQGDERDIIIFSIGYAKNEYGKVLAHFGPLSIEGGENRLNVAITRAKEKIYVVTSIEPEELEVENSKNLGPKLFKQYLKYVRAVSNENKLEAKILLESLSGIQENKEQELSGQLEQEIAKELTKNGYTIESNLGNTNYKISLAVYDKKLKKYLLGIETDSSAYYGSPNVLERDVYHPAFMKSRGWNIVRVWSRDWWLNKNKVVNQLIKQIELQKSKLEK